MIKRIFSYYKGRTILFIRNMSIVHLFLSVNRPLAITWQKNISDLLVPAQFFVKPPLAITSRESFSISLNSKRRKFCRRWKGFVRCQGSRYNPLYTKIAVCQRIIWATALYVWRGIFPMCDDELQTQYIMLHSQWHAFWVVKLKISAKIQTG